tara:strand:- start:355 stop:480 length:126 start_codon:yes stop_codon:yes gene_type:complete
LLIKKKIVGKIIKPIGKIKKGGNNKADNKPNTKNFRRIFKL